MDSAPDFAAPASVSLVIAGGGKITIPHLTDLMDDWLRLGTDDPVDARVWLPGDETTYTSAVMAAANWAAKDGRPGVSVVVPDHDLQTQAVWPYGKGAFTVSAAEIDASVAATLIEVLQEDNREEKRQPYIVLAWGAQDDPPDQFTEELMTAATEAGIPILEIAAKGLQELDTYADTEQIETLEDTQATGKDSLVVADEAQAAVEPPVTEPTVTEPSATTLTGSEPTQPGLAYTLRQCEKLLLSQVIRHEALWDEPCEPPLLKAVIHWLDRVRKEGPDAVLQAEDDTPRVEVTTITPEPKPVTRQGRSRAKAGQVAVFLSQDGLKAVGEGAVPQADDIVIAKGRPRSGWVRRSVDQSLVPPFLLVA